MKPLSKIAFSQAQRRFLRLSAIISDIQIRTGWIHYLRQAIGMSLAVLAKRTGVTVPTAQQIEKRELSGKVTLSTMRKIASAMDCEFIYAIVPREDLGDYLDKKAQEKAKKLISEADTHMSLEDQKVTEDLTTRLRLLAEELREKGDIW